MRRSVVQMTQAVRWTCDVALHDNNNMSVCVQLPTWKTSLAHFLQRLCWHGRMTTGFVNISRHMGQISCFSRFSMVFMLWLNTAIEAREAGRHRIRERLLKLANSPVRCSRPRVRLGPCCLLSSLGVWGSYLAAVSSVYSSYCCHVRGCHFYLALIWNRAGRALNSWPPPPTMVEVLRPGGFEKRT